MNGTKTPPAAPVQDMAEAILAVIDANTNRPGVTFGYLADRVPGFSAAKGEPSGEVSLAYNGHAIVLWANLSAAAAQALQDLTGSPDAVLTYEPTTEFAYVLDAADSGAMHFLNLPVLTDIAALRPAKRAKRFWAPMLVGRRTVIADHIAKQDFKRKGERK